MLESVLFQKGIVVRLYPTIKQKKVLDDHFNAYRFCYNLCLEYKSSIFKWYGINKSGYDMQSELFSLRKEVPWLSTCKAECIRDAALNVEKSYIKFFKNESQFPKYKSRRGPQSFFAYQSIYAKCNIIKFYGCPIKFKTSEKYKQILNESKIKKITFKKDTVGNYWASCSIEMLVDMPKPLTKSIGIDMGIKELITTSDGIFYENNKYLKKSHLKISALQKRIERCKIGSLNRNKLKIKIAKAYKKSTRQKYHYYHQVTNEIIRDNQTIIIEGLKINNMLKNHNLARSISDCSWGIIKNMLSYKSAWNGRKLVVLDTFYPSSKTCSNCGAVANTLLLSQRIYECQNCGLVIDRDVNAAINIRNSGLKIPGVPVEGYSIILDEAGSNSLIINH